MTARLHGVGGARGRPQLAEEAARVVRPEWSATAEARATEIARRIAEQVAATQPGTPAPEVLLYDALCVAELTRVMHVPIRPCGTGRSRAPGCARHPGGRLLCPLASR